MAPFWIQPTADSRRRTKYAGSWYEGNSSKLKLEIEKYISEAGTSPEAESNRKLHTSSAPVTADVLAIVSPHAGFMFSGPTAAYAYKTAQQRKISRIFLLGPSHHIAFRGAGLPAAIVFVTPLGDLEVDKELVSELKTYPLFSVQADVHAVEHSLELQLPFIKHCFGDAKIVPIVIGQLADPTEARLIGQVLKNFLQPDDLIVVSSDFTHYGPRYGYIPFGYSEDTFDRVSKMDGEAFTHLAKLDLDGFADFLARTNDTICGMYPCQVLLSMLPSGAHGSLLKYATSRDSSMEDKENSVSYLSIVFSGASWTKPQASSGSELAVLTENEKQSLLTLARKTIEIYVKENRKPSIEELSITLTPTLKECFGVFVTLNKKSIAKAQDEHKELRGCIGSIYPTQALYKGVQENAIAACSRDYRFSPVEASELNDIEIDINVLTPPKRIASYNDIVVGRDGVILSKGGAQSVFLPQVATEWGWNLQEMLSQLSLKAGLRRDDWREGAKFDVFQSTEFH